MTSDAPAPIPSSPPPAVNRNESGGLGRELGGDLPCVVCGYNLRGLSIRSMCPECGSGVRATILALVDPQAGELQPITLPRFTGGGIVVWAAGAIAVAMACWLPHIADALRLAGISAFSKPNIELAVVLGLATSMAGSLALIRPHAHIPWHTMLMSTLATLLYVPLTWSMLQYQRAAGQARINYFSNWSPNADTTLFLAISCGLIAAIIILERPIARLLVARSLVMRTGRVDRQTMVAMAIAVALIAVGGAIGHYAPTGHPMWLDLARHAGAILIGFGSLLLSIGLIGSLVDCARIASAILAPSPTLRQVIREGHSKPLSRMSMRHDAAASPSSKSSTPAA